MVIKTKEELKQEVRSLKQQLKAATDSAKSIHDAHKERLYFEDMITDLSVALVKMASDAVDKRVEQILLELGKMFGFDRIDFAQSISGTDQVRLTHSFTIKGFERYGRISAKEYYPKIAEKLEPGTPFHFTTKELGDEYHREKQNLKQMGIKSGIILAYKLPHKRFGAICFGSHTHYKKLLVDKHPKRLRFLAEVMVNALIRRQAEREIKEAFVKIKLLKNQLQHENTYLKEEINTIKKYGEIVGDSQAIAEVMGKVKNVARTNATVLVSGETGTGKELVARAIHKMSSRNSRAMVTVNCAALPATLIESELFGREKGAYTGALSKQVGKFETADGSTIFLDEIGELPLELQSKLLRVLQQGELQRLGSNKTIQVDVRVIAATNRDLKKEVQNGSFREDLYYRLEVYPIKVPALRERRGDIIPLAQTFIDEFNTTMGKPVETVSKTSLESLARYDWPGNVRELRNVVERSMITCRSGLLTFDMPEQNALPDVSFPTLEAHQKDYILKVLERTGWQIRGEKGAARILDLKPTTLYSRMKKLGIKRP